MKLKHQAWLMMKTEESKSLCGLLDFLLDGHIGDGLLGGLSEFPGGWEPSLQR